MNIDEPAIAEIVKELKSSGVYVDKSLAGQLPPDFQAQLREQVSEAKHKVFIAMVPVDRDDPSFHGDTELLAGVLHSDVNQPGVYLTYRESNGSVDGSTYGVGYGLYDAWFAARAEHPDDLQQQLTSTLKYLENGQGTQAYEQARAKQKQQEQTGTSVPHPTGGDDGSGPMPVVGWLVVALVIAGAALAIRKAVRRKPRAHYVAGKGYVTDRPFELPAATLSMIRQSRDRELERRTESEVLALGEAIDSADLNGGTSVAWQAALDHYDLARRILDGTHSQADVVGALVLTERGQSALSAARANKPWQPQVGCYFNPLHGAGTATVDWRGRAGTARVPACRECAAAIGRGDEPDDVLDFVMKGEAKHYFDLDIEPWSSTGYGALSPDLIARLFRAG